MTENMYSFIWNEAMSYLLSFQEVNLDIITKHTGYYKINKPTSINELFRGLVKSLPNRQGMSNWIKNVEDFQSLFFNFNPTEVSKVYKDWKGLFHAIEDSGLRPFSTMDINEPRNAWVHFSKGVIDGANFISSFSNISEFDRYVNRYVKENRLIDLANSIQRKIHGYGFALACDFLKENGYPEFVKPDTHLLDIFCELGLTKSDSQIDVFNAVISFSKEVNELPYIVDKIFWLIGSGDFYLEPDLPIVKVDKYDFCKNVKKKLEERGIAISPIKRREHRKKTKKVDDEKKKQFRVFVELLNEIRGNRIITAQEMRDIKKQWMENENDRTYLYNRLKEIKAKGVGGVK